MFEFRKKEEPKRDLELIKQQIIEKTLEAKHEKEKNISYLVTYSLKGKTPLDKVKFVHQLEGRGNKEGLLQKMGGEKMGRGCFLIPTGKEEVFKLLEDKDVEFEKKKVSLLD